MTPVEKQIRKILEANATLPFDEAYRNIATEVLPLKDSGKITWVVIAGKDDRCTSVDVGLPNGTTLEVEIL